MVITQNLNWLKKIPWLLKTLKNSTAIAFLQFHGQNMHLLMPRNPKSWNAMAMASSTGPPLWLQETGGSKKELAYAARMPGTTSGVPSWIEKEVAATCCRYGVFLWYDNLYDMVDITIWFIMV